MQQKDIATRLGVSRAWVCKTLQRLDAERRRAEEAEARAAAARGAAASGDASRGAPGAAAGLDDEDPVAVLRSQGRGLEEEARKQQKIDPKLAASLFRASADIISKAERIAAARRKEAPPPDTAERTRVAALARAKWKKILEEELAEVFGDDDVGDDDTAA